MCDPELLSTTSVAGVKKSTWRTWRQTKPLMASTGVTSADFGNTRKSKKFSNTRVSSADDEADTTSVTPAAKAFLSELRSELLGGSSARGLAPAQPVQQRARPAEPPARVPQQRAAPSASTEDGRSRPEQQHKRHLNCAERKKEKKRRKAEAEGSRN